MFAWMQPSLSPVRALPEQLTGSRAVKPDVVHLLTRPEDLEKHGERVNKTLLDTIVSIRHF